MAQFYLDGRGAGGGVAGQALRNFNSMGERDAAKQRHKIDTETTRRQQERQDKLNYYKSDQLTLREKMRNQGLVDVTNAQQAGGLSIAQERGRTRRYEVDMTTEPARRRAEIFEQDAVNRWGREGAATRMSNTAQHSKNAEAIFQSIAADGEKAYNADTQQSIATLINAQNANSGYLLQQNIFRGTPTVPESAKMIVVPGHGLVWQATTEDGRTVHKATNGSAVSEDATTITPASSLQALHTFGAYQQAFSDKIPDYQKTYSEKKRRQRLGEEGKLTPAASSPGTGGYIAPAVPAGEAAPNGKTLANDPAPDPAESQQPVPQNDQAVNGSSLPQQSVADVVRTAENTGVGANVIQAGNEVDDAYDSDDPNVALAAVQNYLQQSWEDPYVLDNDDVPGMDTGTQQSASSPDTMVAQPTADTFTVKGVPDGLVQQIAAQLQQQNVGNPQQPVAPPNMSNDQVADFYNTGQSGYGTPQTGTNPQVRSLLGDTAPADRPLVPTSMAGWKEDIGADLRGIGNAFGNVASRMSPVPRANAAIEPQPVSAPPPPAAAAPKEEGPSFADRARQAGQAIKGAADRFGDGRLAINEAKTAATEAKKSQYSEALTASKEDMAAVEIRKTTSAYPGGGQGSSGMSALDATAGAQYFKRRGLKGDDRNQYDALGDRLNSMNPEDAAYQQKANAYHRMVANEAREGVLSADGRSRTPAPQRESQEQATTYYMGNAVQKLQRENYNAIDEVAIENIDKMLKERGVDVGDVGTPTGMSKMVHRAFNSSEADMRRYTAQVGQSHTNIAEWSEPEKEHLIRLVVKDVTTPSYWRGVGNKMRRWPVIKSTGWNGPNPTASPAETLRSQTYLAEEFTHDTPIPVNEKTQGQSARAAAVDSLRGINQ
jgi:hypothetical protein